MQLHSESIEVTDVERAKIRVKCVIEEGLVDCEIDGRMDFRSYTGRSSLGFGGALRWRAVLSRIGKWSMRIRRMGIRC